MTMKGGHERWKYVYNEHFNCINSKDFVKTVTRHIRKGYEKMADEVRHTPIYQWIYKAQKETIERISADAKGKHGVRYTRSAGTRRILQ